MPIRALALLSAALFVFGCSPPGAPAAKAASSPAPPVPVQAAASPANHAPVWLICEEMHGGAVVTLSTPDATSQATTITQYSHADRTPREETLTLGEGEGAAGSTYQALLRGGADAGHIRMLNAGVGIDPDAATTPALTEVLLGEQNHECRWLAHTRFVGFDARRSFWITEDAKGALTYQTFDFASAAQARELELDNGQRSTAPNVSVSGGHETTDASGTLYTFEHDGWRYEVRTPQATVTVLHGGAVVQTEPLLAYEVAEDRD